MATGFTQRFRGKVTIGTGGLWYLGNNKMLNTVYSTAGSQSIDESAGMASITASSGASVFGLDCLPIQGVEKQLYIAAVSSSVFIRAQAGVSFDPSTNTVIKSTYGPQMITLVGRSSTKWAIQSVFPGSTAGIVAAAGITLSTTT